MHSPTRIATPMVREGWQPGGGGDRTGRGRDNFVPISWDRALDLVAEELTRVRREHGPGAVMGGSRGGRRPGSSTRPARSSGPLLLGAQRRVCRPGQQLQFRHRADLPPAHPRHRAGGCRPADLVDLDRPAFAAFRDVRRRQSEKHAGQQGRLRLARHQRVFGRASPRPACASLQHQPDPRGRAEVWSSPSGSRSAPIPTPR